MLVVAVTRVGAMELVQVIGEVGAVIAHELDVRRIGFYYYPGMIANDGFARIHSGAPFHTGTH